VPLTLMLIEDYESFCNTPYFVLLISQFNILDVII